MEHQQPPTAGSPQLSDPPPPPSSLQQQPHSSAAPPSSPNPNPNPKTPPSPSPSQPRPSTFARPWQPPPHFSSLPPSTAPPSLSSSVSPPVSASAPPRPGMAIGVPASPSPQPLPFASSFGQQFGGRSVPEQPSNSTSNSSQVRPPMQGMGMMGLSGSSSQMRPAGIPAHLQQRPLQSSLRPPASPSNQPPAPQNFQGHGLLRGSSAGSPGSPSPNTSQGLQSINQPWLSSGGPHGKPPLPSPSYRAQINPQSMQQRSHIPQQQPHHLPRSITHQLQLSSTQAHQPSPLPPHQPHDHYGQQLTPSVPQSLPHQPQISRVMGSGSQKPSSLATVQPTSVQSGTLNRIANAENDESSNRILSKRSIHELVSQIDPLEKLDPDVEDILVDIAEDFIDSITTFGCSLAKHRKSNMLEAKDVLLHLERNWNISLPGFGGDEIKSYRKLPTNDIHRERLSVIKRSVSANEMVNSKNSSGQGAGNVKGNLAKMPANAFSSPNVKIREAS